MLEFLSNWEKTLTDKTRWRTATVPIRDTACNRLDTRPRAPMKAEFASCRIFAAMATSFEMMRSTFPKEMLSVAGPLSAHRREMGSSESTAGIRQSS